MIKLRKNGLEKRVSTGFSIKSLLFGVFYPIARGDQKGILNQTLLVILTGGLCWLIIPFIYNKTFIKRQLQDGWIPSDEKSLRYCEKKFNYKLA